MKLGRSRASSRIFVIVFTCCAFGLSLGAAARWSFESSPGERASVSSDTVTAESPAIPSDSSAFERFATAMYPEMLDKLPPFYQQLFIERLAAEMDPNNGPLVMVCMAPDTPQEIVDLFTFGSSFDGRYNQTGRWSSTASGSTGNQGDPITLTYGFPPDGITIPSMSGFPSGTNQFNAWMNSLYGNQTVWKPIFDQVFTRWGQLCGITYVYEPNDDGVTMNQNPGVLNVRADVRIGAKTLDGGSGVLAYNNFPNDGDMVLDAFDSFYNNTSNVSRGLRNVIAHEHGHGLGMLHVCPIQQTKLMEPFVSTSYDGPRHDDVRNSHRHYGDPFEPNNSTGQATDLGTFGVGGSANVGLVPSPTIPSSSVLSIDANAEVDYFRFQVSQPVSINVTVLPLGLTYDDSDQSCPGQSGSCCSGNNVDTLSICDLAFDILASNGTTVLATRNATTAGNAETLNGTSLNTVGTYYIRVYETNAPIEVQLYRLNLSFTAPVFSPPSIVLPNGAPSVLLNGDPTVFNVTINPNDDTLVPGTANLFYRYFGGAYTGVALTSTGGNNYQATLPATDCSATPEFFISVNGTTAGQITLPAGGGAAPFTAIMGPLAFNDNFETDQGWTVSGSASDGHWERGIPVTNFNRGAPLADFDGSSRCYLSDNDAANENSDIDNGETILTSPVFSMTAGDAVSYAYWFNDTTAGPLAGGDSLRVEVATNAAGNNWATVRNYTTALGQWRTDSLVAGTDFSASTTIRVRFTANDIGTQNIVEAGIDAFIVDGCVPQQVPVPNPPTGLAAADDISCDEIALTWSASTGADDYEVWRNSVNNSGTATMIADSIVATNYSDTTAPAGSVQFYWVKACNTSGCSGFSTTDSGSRLDVPPAPTGVAATSETVCGAVDITWNDVPVANAFNVWRNTVDNFGTAALIDSTIGLATRDASGDPALTYFYWVTAEGDCGESAASLSAQGSASPKGDFNFDGFIDGNDLQGYVDALLGDVEFFDCADLAAPFGLLDEDDTQAMVDILVAP